MTTEGCIRTMGDLDNDNRLDIDPSKSPYALEDTGLNRFKGSKQQDELYGGTGLDFLYGNDAPKGSPDRLYRRDGTIMTDVGSTASDAWKEFAKETNLVWYYSGSELDDIITVDYVTEPGLLGGRHIITRRTSNQDNSTFDAQIRLSPKAVDRDGKPIWNPTSLFLSEAIIGAGDTESGSQFTLGSDPVNPQVLTIDAGQFNGRLTGDAVFMLQVFDRVPVTIALPVVDARTGIAAINRIETGDNKSLSHLVRDLNDALSAAGVGDVVEAESYLFDTTTQGVNRYRIRLALAEGQETKQIDRAESLTPLSILYANEVAERELGFLTGQISTRVETGIEDFAELLPAEDDFKAIIVDARGGNDSITVGPTVIKSVWVDGGADDDHIEILPGRPILVDQTETLKDRRNEINGFALNQKVFRKWI